MQVENHKEEVPFSYYEEKFRELNPDVDAGMVKEDILLPTGYTNKYGQTDTLTWESSMPHVISETGKVCRPQLQCDVVLNVRIDGKIAGSLRLTVAGMDSFTGRQINAAYSNETIALDGVISEEGWALNAEAFADGIQLLRMGAQWQKDMLYLAIDTPDLSKLQLTLAGKQLDMNTVNKFTSGTVTELCIPFENLGLSWMSMVTRFRVK